MRGNSGGAAESPTVAAGTFPVASAAPGQADSYSAGGQVLEAAGKSQTDIAAVVRPLDAASWPTCPWQCRLNLRGAVTLLKLTLKRRQRDCWQAVTANSTEHSYPAGPRKLLPPSTMQSTCLPALFSHQPRAASNIARNDHHYSLSSEQPAEQGTTQQHTRTVFSLAVSKCKCKTKTVILISTPNGHISSHLSNLHSDLASLVPDTIQLGLVVRGRFRPSTDLHLPPHPRPSDFFGHIEYGGRLEWSRCRWTQAHHGAI